MSSVTVYVLKKDRSALLDDITTIIKKSNIALSSQCIEELAECLETKLEPMVISYSPKDPNRAIDMANSARLRKAKARKEKQVTASKLTAKSQRRPHPEAFDPTIRFGRFGGPRNVNESFMDRDFVPPDSALRNKDEHEHQNPVTTEAASKRVDSHNRPSTDTYNRFGGPRNINETFISSVSSIVNTASADRPWTVVKAPKKTATDSSLAAKPPVKKDSFEHPPEGVNASFYFPNTAPSFAEMYPNADQSAYSKRPDLEEPLEALESNEPIDITKGDCLVFEEGILADYEPSDLVPHTKREAKQTPVPESIQLTLASADRVMAHPELTIQKSGDNIDAPDSTHTDHSDIKQNSQPIPAITVTEYALVNTQTSYTSSKSSASSKFQSSQEEAKESQNTPDSTYYSQSQDALTQPQSGVASQATDPKDLLQPPAPAARRKKALTGPKKPVEINPRRSARLAGKTSATDPAPVAPPPPVLDPSGKRGRKDDVEDGEERGYHNKKVISKAVVEKQRETRSQETKRGGRDRRTVLQRRAV